MTMETPSKIILLERLIFFISIPPSKNDKIVFTKELKFPFKLAALKNSRHDPVSDLKSFFDAATSSRHEVGEKSLLQLHQIAANDKILNEEDVLDVSS